MSANPGELYSSEEIQNMRNQIGEIDLQLANIERLTKVNRTAGKDVFPLTNQKEQLLDARKTLEAIIAEFG